MYESNTESTSEPDQWTPDWRNRQALAYLNAYNERFPLREGETAPQRFIRARAAGGIRYPAWENDSIIKARFRHLAGTAIPDSEWTAAFDLGEGLIRTNPDTLDAGVIKGWLLAGLTDEEIAARHPLTPFQIRVFHNTWFDVRSHSLLPHDLLRITCGEPPETETSNWENRERRVLWIALSCGRSTLDEFLNPPSILVRDSITFERLEWEGGKRLRYKTRLYPNGGRMVGTHPRVIRLRRPVQDDSPVASSDSCTEQKKLFSTRTRRAGCGTLSNCQMLTAKPRRSQRDAEQDRIFLDNPFSFATLCFLCASAVNLQVTQKAFMPQFSQCRSHESKRGHFERTVSKSASLRTK